MTISLTDPNPDVLDPIVEANMLPVQTKVSNSLSEDTLWADVMLPPSGRNAVALFANPFADHTEEMLYIDPQGQLAWARHSSGDTAGWTEELLTDPGDRAYEVVTVVHPNNVVFAFVLVASGTPVQPNLRTYCLERSALGGVGWVLVPNPQPMPPLYNPSQLSVYYPATRPLVPWVFLTEDHIGNPVVVPIVAEAPTDDTGPGTGMWWTADPVLGVPFDNLAGAEVLCGVDNPLEQPSMVVWVLTPDQVLVQCTYPAPGKVNKDIVLEHVLAMAGLYVTPRGVGVVAVQAGPQPTLSTLVVVSRVVDGARTSWKVVSNPVDFSMSSAQAWQDQQGYLHVFGKHGTDVHVVHQIDYTVEPGSSALIPRFTMLDAGLGPVALSTSIATSVSSFTVDSCPDQYPSQFVLHTAPEPVGEQWAIYTQDVETSWWSRENVRFQSNPQVYSAARYKSQITLLDSYGGPVQGYPVALSSGQSVEVEVAGRYYRLGPGVQPAQLTTDFLGRVTVKVIAASLGGTTLSLSAQGMPGSTTINPAVDVHNYLAGSGTLPNHPAVITAEALQDAKDSAGDWVFPAWHVLDHGLGAVPTADQVLGWCAELFEPPSGASRMVSGADGEPVLARYLSLQTSDSSRPAFETFGPDDDVDLGWDGVVEMAGDFWEAIRSGAIAVKKTVIDLAAGLARITVAGYDNVEYAFTVVWDKVIEAAHVVEAIFNSLLAKISAVIDWLKWTMDIKDVFETKDAMTGMLLQLPDLLENYLNAVFVDIVPGWFTSKRGLVEQYLDLAIQFATNPISEPPGPRATGRREPRLPGAPELSEFEFADQPELLRDPSKLDNPHVMWWLDQIISLSQSPGSSPVASPGQDDPPSWAVKVIQAMKDVIATLGDSPAGVELGKAYDEFAA
ncbi:MAG TPA: hypothetical protein VIJ54_12430, partial [Actinomycetes bacterium]